MDDSNQDIRLPLQKSTARQLSLEQVNYLEHYREHLFYAQDKPILLEILNTILEQQGLEFNQAPL